GLYSGIFGSENGALLAKYMARMSQITNDEGLNDDNRAEHEELNAKYQELLNSLGGQQRIIDYSMNFYNSAMNNEDSKDSEDFGEDDSEDEESTAGIVALDEAIENLYGEQEGFCFQTTIPYFLGGNDPLDMVRIFETESGGISHWHYITYGFTELYDKESDDEEISGFGFELTFRLKKNENEPPIWPVNLLQNIARYVFNTGNIFAPGHHMNANGPIQLGYDTEITALGFISDPELPEIDTENGSVEFIQMVGITNDEMEAVMCWNCRKLLNLFNEFIPLGITDLDRKSFMSIEKVQNTFRAGVETDGSSTSYIYTDFIAVSMCKNGHTSVYGSSIAEQDLALNDEADIPTIYLGAYHVERIILMLRGRLLKGEDFTINGENTTLFFTIGDSCKVTIQDDDIDVILTKEAIDEITEKLQPKIGEYMLSSGKINFKVLKTEITDSEGNIVKTIG
ncbi:MAG: suppressor of fused domain protein, partial [Lachnospiraceae bacterium]|nr:suppressor of fused domain protein [Lachnospiraceae bacterium]